ncbi:MAG: GNAT family protein [Candidatus Hydrogenedentes bacterium]|nr:GNAT family protein [Candidatus Hydrogenedentota bacterium]
MIVSQHTVIRSAEPDDASDLLRIYDLERPRCCLLDGRREFIIPTRDELREVMAQKEMGRNLLYAVEDKQGGVRRFCSLRGVNLEASFMETVLMFHDDADLDTPLADEAFAFLTQHAFVRLKLNKLLAYTLDTEEALRRFLLAHGFQSHGVQREIVFWRGGWHNIEAFSLFHTGSASPT